MFESNPQFRYLSRDLPKRLPQLLFAVAILLVLSFRVAEARHNPWSQPQPPVAPNNAGNWSSHSFLQAKQGVPGMVPHSGQVGKDFWSSFVSKRIPPGTVLTGTLDTTLSSKKSQRGDVFALVLEDGFVNSGRMVVPPGSKIVGAVIGVFKATAHRGGMPGRVTLSLQTLVFPDGRSTKFFGLVDHNPAHDQLKEPKTRFSGFGLSEYGQSLKGMIGSFGSGIGWVQMRRQRGKEFKLEQGQKMAVKVNRTIDLNSMTLPVGGPGFVPGIVSDGTNNALPFGAPPRKLEGGTYRPPPSGVPGLEGPDPEAAYRSSAGTPGGSVPGLVSQPAVPSPAGSTIGRGASRGLVSPPPVPAGHRGMSLDVPGVRKTYPGRIPSNATETRATSGGLSARAAQPALQGGNNVFNRPLDDPTVNMPDPF